MPAKWHEIYSVNIKELDAQHKKIAALLTELNLKNGLKNTGRLLETLVAYSTYHFQSEEKLFHDFSYPDKEAHIKEHCHFLKKIKSFQKKFRNHTLKASELADFIGGWWIDHVNNSDFKYSAFLNGRGVF